MNLRARFAEVQVNGRMVAVDNVPGRRLSEILRDQAGCRDVKVGCDAGDCGACTVLVDGAPHCACLMPLAQAAGRTITTLAGLTREGEDLPALHQAFLRHGAAQCGICTPGMLVTAAALLARNPQPSRAEVEDALGGVLCRCTGYAKIVDAVCDHAGRGAPVVAETGSAVGARLPRLDGRPKVTGTETFGADHVPEAALLVRAVRSPHPLADFVFGDLVAWVAAHPGVETVLTAADIPGRNRFGVIPPLADQPALAEGTARFRGEAVAVVAGQPDAVEALDLTEFPVSWTAREAAMSPSAALAPEAARLHAERPDNILIRGRVARGDPDTALAGSAHTVAGGFETAFVEHAYIEPEAGAAWWQGRTLVIQACTQAPVMDRDDVAVILGLPPERVRIIPAAAGGGFGAKLDLSLQPLIGLVTLVTGRPCRMVYTRRESMASTTKRHPGAMQARIGTDAEGRVTGMVFEGDFDTGAYASWGPTVATRVPVHASGPYAVPHYRAETRAVHTNGPIAGAFRGFGVPQAAILQETLYDRLAEACGLDRLAFRRRNALPEGGRTVCGQQLFGVGIDDCLAALENSWAEALSTAAAANAAERAAGGVLRHGVGVASCWYGCGNTALPNPSTIRIGLTADGFFCLHQGATDIGQGANTVIAQIAADAVGLPVGQIYLIGPDTALTPDCGKTSASRQTYVTGRAAQAAGRALRTAILRLANLSENATLCLCGDELRLWEGGRSRRIALGDLPVDSRGYVFSAEETYNPPTEPLDADGQGVPYAVYGYGAQIAQVAVDTELGTVRVTRMTAAHDLGRVINPQLAEGQIEGGIAQGLGLALMEEYIPGRTENLHDYLIPTFGDMPEIRSILIERPDPEGPMGAKGLGEHVLIPTAPAIFNAIRHATGAEIDRAPALPHRVLAAIRAAHGA
ncbi:MAG: molybdopterin cofactor-binding domain-containing protein [Pseudomonadota bacterium]